MKKYSLAMAAALLVGGFAGEAYAQSEIQIVAPGSSYLGIGVREVDSARAQALKLKEERGVEVTSVEQGSPAEQAGVKVGDVVVGFAGEDVQGIDQFVRLVREMPAGRKVKLVVFRNGSTTNLTATVATRKGPIAQRAPVPAPQVPQVWVPDIPHPATTWRTPMLGVEAEALQGQLAQYFGVTSGVLVRAIIEGSAAEKAGLKAGDVVTKVAGVDVAAPRDISRQLQTVENRTMPIAIITIRDHKEMTVNVTLSDANRGGGRLGGRLELYAD
jgi:serine protease Do